MKPFDLEKALAGEKVVTRDGREVTQVTKFDLPITAYKIRAVLDGTLESFTLDGRYRESGEETVFDLFMAPTKLSGFINIYADGFCSDVFITDCGKHGHRIACIDLSQFEEGHGL